MQSILTVLGNTELWSTVSQCVRIKNQIDGCSFPVATPITSGLSWPCLSKLTPSLALTPWTECVGRWCVNTISVSAVTYVQSGSKTYVWISRFLSERHVVDSFWLAKRFGPNRAFFSCKEIQNRSSVLYLFATEWCYDLHTSLCVVVVSRLKLSHCCCIDNVPRLLCM